jgi:cytochrome P450
VIREITERDLQTWPVGRPFAMAPPHAADHAGRHPARRLGVRGPERLARARHLVDEFARRNHAVLLFPLLRRRFGRFSPLARFERAREELDAFLVEEIAARRSAADGAERDDVSRCCSTPLTTTDR